MNENENKPLKVEVKIETEKPYEENPFEYPEEEFSLGRAIVIFAVVLVFILIALSQRGVI